MPVINSLSNKLSTGLGLCVVLLIFLAVFDFFALQKLAKLYQQSLKRAEEMRLAADAQHVGEDLYMIIANSVINRDLAKSARDWELGKKTNQKELKKLAAAADIPEERIKVMEAQQAFIDIINIYELEMLPLIMKGAVVAGPLADMDARIDRKIESIDTVLQNVAQSMSNENQIASREFNAVLHETIRLGMILSLIGVAVALAISVLSRRRIVRPLSELTQAALELRKGNYHVELRHQSDDEIGILSDAFRDMSTEVKKRTAELLESNMSLKHEIDGRKMVEEEVCRVNAELEQRVEERTVELVITNQHLKQMISSCNLAENDLRSSREELRSLSHHLQNVREDERSAIAREIHDELGQLLTALKMDISWLGGKLPVELNHLYKKTREMALHIDGTISTVQRISSELRPGILDDLGLTAAIEWQTKEFLKESGIIFRLESSIDCLTMDRTLATALFRIFQESLTNICRHAEATEVCLTLDVQGGELVMAVMDNGTGINEKKKTAPKSLGLIGMRERVHHFGGELSINRIPAGGTCVRVNIPLARNEKENDDDTNTHSG